MVRHLLAGVLIAVWSADASAERSPSRLNVKPVLLTMAMTGECRARDEVLALARTEAARVWSQAAVAIRWVAASELPYGSPPVEWLLVRCADVPAPGATLQIPAVVPIAAIRFIAERPTNTIVLNIDNAETLLQRDSVRSPGEAGWLIAFHNIRLGRMLGRAIAHEVGHFLSQSGAHTRSGLMRASHTVAAFTGVSLGPFRAPDSSQY